MHASQAAAEPLCGHVLLQRTMFFCSLLIDACGGDKIGNTSSLQKHSRESLFRILRELKPGLTTTIIYLFTGKKKKNVFF